MRATSKQTPVEQTPLHKARDAQCGIFAEALTIYTDRHKVRGDLWAEASQPEDLIGHMENKVLRAKHALNQLVSNQLVNKDPVIHDAAEAEAEDSLLDLINYSAFALRWLRG